MPHEPADQPTAAGTAAADELAQWAAELDAFRHDLANTLMAAQLATHLAAGDVAGVPPVAAAVHELDATLEALRLRLAAGGPPPTVGR